MTDSNTDYAVTHLKVSELALLVLGRNFESKKLFLLLDHVLRVKFITKKEESVPRSTYPCNTTHITALVTRMKLSRSGLGIYCIYKYETVIFISKCTKPPGVVRECNRRDPEAMVAQY